MLSDSCMPYTLSSFSSKLLLFFFFILFVSFSIIDDVENQEAFKKHFEELMNCYKKVAIVTLLEQEGREEGLGDAFMQNVVVYNNPQLTYISFDFHEHW